MVRQVVIEPVEMLTNYLSKCRKFRSVFFCGLLTEFGSIWLRPSTCSGTEANEAYKLVIILYIDIASFTKRPFIELAVTELVEVSKCRTLRQAFTERRASINSATGASVKFTLTVIKITFYQKKFILTQTANFQALCLLYFNLPFT